MTVLPGATPTDTCRLAYDNLLTRGDVVASTEQDDYPVVNCFNGVSHDFFKPTVGGTTTIELTLDAPEASNYFAFYNQDLYVEGASIKLQYHDGSVFVDCFNAIVPDDNSPRVIFFDVVSASGWKIVIESVDVISLGEIAFGQYLPLPFGMYLNWTPPQLADDAELLNSLSETGTFLGRTEIAQGIKTSIELQYAEDQWVRSNWPDFRDHAKERPFFWVPNFRDYPNESVFCWAEGKIPMPRHTHYSRMGCSIPIRGLIE